MVLATRQKGSYIRRRRQRGLWKLFLLNARPVRRTRIRWSSGVFRSSRWNILIHRRGPSLWRVHIAVMTSVIVNGRRWTIPEPVRDGRWWLLWSCTKTGRCNGRRHMRRQIRISRIRNAGLCRHRSRTSRQFVRYAIRIRTGQPQLPFATRRRYL